MNRKIMLGVVALLTLVLLAACGGNNDTTSDNNSDGGDSTENTEMDAAQATNEGPYDTTAYEVTYEPNDGGETVKNHKWVIHEEIKDAEEQPYEKGDEVVLEADHMEGMKGATATIDDSEDTTVYML